MLLTLDKESTDCRKGGTLMAVDEAFVLGGGGARGALQVGHYVLCSCRVADLIVGRTSVGAMNATCLALERP